ncbi:hypothetical protein MASR2M78_29370 [Treponema sp.]
MLRSCRGAFCALVEDAGLELRSARLATSRVRLSLFYADGVRTEAEERLRAPLFLDSDLIAAASRALERSSSRRIRVRGLSLGLAGLGTVLKELDLFEPEGSKRRETLQVAVDAARRRFGIASVTRASVLVASHA